MSYEGSVQILCKNGHYGVNDVYTFEGDDYKCHFCGEESAFFNSVDDTNCESWGEIDMEQFRIKRAEYEECPTCYHKNLIVPEIYRIPTEEERQKARRYRPEFGNSPLMPLP